MRITADACAIAAVLSLPEPKWGQAQSLLEIPYRLTRRGQALRIVQPDGALGTHTDRDQALVNLLLLARRWWTRLETGSTTVAQLARAEGISAA